MNSIIETSSDPPAYSAVYGIVHTTHRTDPDRVYCELLSEKAKLPTKGSSQSAGFDLFSPTKFTLFPQSRVTVDLGIALQIPSYLFGKIEARSSLAKQFGIIVLGGVVDSDYRGSVSVILYNSGNWAWDVDVGYRIAQIVFQSYYIHNLIEVKGVGETERGTGGFGSTGK